MGFSRLGASHANLKGVVKGLRSESLMKIVAYRINTERKSTRKRWSFSTKAFGIRLIEVTSMLVHLPLLMFSWTCSRPSQTSHQHIFGPSHLSLPLVKLNTNAPSSLEVQNYWKYSPLTSHAPFSKETNNTPMCIILMIRGIEFDNWYDNACSIAARCSSPRCKQWKF